MCLVNKTCLPPSFQAGLVLPAGLVDPTCLVLPAGLVDPAGLVEPHSVVEPAGLVDPTGFPTCLVLPAGDPTCLVLPGGEVVSVLEGVDYRGRCSVPPAGLWYPRVVVIGTTIEPTVPVGSVWLLTVARHNVAQTCRFVEASVFTSL